MWPRLRMSVCVPQSPGLTQLASFVRDWDPTTPTCCQGFPDRERHGMSTQDQTFVIVGAALAGAKAAETLRAEGFDGRLMMIGEEPERPYERPPLSKDYLRGDVPREKAYVHEEGFYADHDIELITATAATALDPERRTLGLSDGRELTYD